MRKKAVVIFWAVCVFAVNCSVAVENNTSVDSTTPVELARYQEQSSCAHIEPARLGGKYGVAVVFEGTEDLHFYASRRTAPAGYELKIETQSDEFGFGELIFPKWTIFTDPLGNNVEVYAGRFAVFIPIETPKAPTKATVTDQGDIEVKISGIACTSTICLTPFEKTLRAKIDLSLSDSWKEISFETPGDSDKVISRPRYSIWLALGLAFLAGLSLNIMPCVWPVLPIIVMRIVEQAKESKGKSVALGLTFCLGILLFFICLAAANIVLQLFYGTVLQWGDQFRNPTFVMGMALLLIVLALFMFGVFTIVLPSSVTGKSGSGKGYVGAVGMGFLAAILSTPCSFAILATAFAWAQAQPLPLGTIAIMFIGIGMAVPYAILTSIPGLLKHIPKPGQWMELFKQAIGFVLLIIAVKLIAALPQVRRTDVLYFAVVLSFCIWMWGGWVSYNTKPLRKWLIRIIAVVLAIIAGRVFLPPPPGELIDWQKYDSDSIQSALAQGRPVLIKFTADWCLSCQAVDKLVYSSEDVAKLIEQKDVLAIKADTTVKDYPATLALKNIYNEPGVPVTVLFTPGKKEPTRWRKMFFVDELKAQLEALADE